MRVWEKFYKLFLAVILCTSILTMPVFASTVSQDGIEAALTTDKEVYDQNEQITATLIVTNTNDFSVSNVSLTSLVPDGYILSDDSETNEQAEILEAGETISLSVTYIRDNGEGGGVVSGDESTTPSEDQTGSSSGISKKTDTVETGDHGNFTFWIVLFVLAGGIIVFVVVKKKKSGKKCYQFSFV